MCLDSIALFAGGLLPCSKNSGKLLIIECLQFATDRFGFAFLEIFPFLLKTLYLCALRIGNESFFCGNTLLFALFLSKDVIDGTCRTGLRR